MSTIFSALSMLPKLTRMASMRQQAVSMMRKENSSHSSVSLKKKPRSRQPAEPPMPLRRPATAIISNWSPILFWMAAYPITTRRSPHLAEPVPSQRRSAAALMRAITSFIRRSPGATTKSSPANTTSLFQLTMSTISMICLKRSTQLKARSS